MNLQLDGQMGSVPGTPSPGGRWISNGYRCICTQGGNEWRGREVSSIALPIALQERDISRLKEERSSLDKH